MVEELAVKRRVSKAAFPLGAIGRDYEIPLNSMDYDELLVRSSFLIALVLTTVVLVLSMVVR